MRVRPLLLTSSDISPLDLPDLADTQGSSDFLPGSRDLGYLEGQNIAIEFRWASSVSDMSALARELVEMNVTSFWRRHLLSSRVPGVRYVLGW